MFLHIFRLLHTETIFKICKSKNIIPPNFLFFLHVSSSSAKILGEKLFRTWEFPRSGAKAKIGSFPGWSLLSISAMFSMSLATWTKMSRSKEPTSSMIVPRLEKLSALPAPVKYSGQLRCMLEATMGATFGNWEVTWPASTSVPGGPVSSWPGSCLGQHTHSWWIISCLVISPV